MIHTHSPSATGYALAGRSIPAHYEALLVHGQPVDVPVAPWAARGTAEAVRSIADTFAAHPDSYAVLLGNHGLLVGGDDAHHASGLAVAIEEAAVLVWPPPRSADRCPSARCRRRGSRIHGILSTPRPPTHPKASPSCPCPRPCVAVPSATPPS